MTEERKSEYQRRYYLKHREELLAKSIARKQAQATARRNAKEAEATRLREAGLKVCPRCRKELPLANFSIARKRKDGLHSYCRLCQSHSARASRSRHPEALARNRRRGREMLEVAKTHVLTIKAQRGCCDCGFRGHPAAMHFHHRDPSEKVATIARLISYGRIDRLLFEMAKCDLLCANCHAIRHAEGGV